MQNAIRAKQRCSRRAELHEAVGWAPDSDGQIPISGNSTERICDPGMSSQIPQIGEYQSMACSKLGPLVPNVAPIVLEGSHSLTSPNGSYDLFSFSPPQQKYHVIYIPLSIVYEPKLTDRSPRPISLTLTQGDQIIQFDVINRECIGIRTFYPSSFDHTWPGYASMQHLTHLGSCQVAHHRFLFLML